MKRSLGVLLLVFVMGTACKKEKIYVYEVNSVSVSQPGINKPSVKEIFEFVSIAYSDVFGNTISSSELNDLATAYESFGDSKLIEDLIIRNFLNKTPNTIPSTATMNADVGAFVSSTYNKLLSRNPDEFELWFLTDLISSDAGSTPELVYYAILTSNEYRQY